MINLYIYIYIIKYISDKIVISIIYIYTVYIINITSEKKSLMEPPHLEIVPFPRKTKGTPC